MSEDPASTALRLKPRLRADGTPVAVEQLSDSDNPHAQHVAAAVAVAPPVAPVTSEGVILKLRPRMSGSADQPALPPSPAPAAPPSSPPVAAVAKVAPPATPPAASARIATPAAVAPLSLAATPVAPSAPAAPATPAAVAIPAAVAPLSLAATPVAPPAPAAPVAPALPAENAGKGLSGSVASPALAPSAVAAPTGQPIDASRFKLKPRAVGPDAPAAPPPGAISVKPLVAVLPPLPALPAPPATASPSPAIAAAAALTKVTAPVPPAVKAVVPSGPIATPVPAARSGSPSISSELAPPQPENSSAFKAGIWVVTTLVVAAVAGGAFFAYRFLHPQEEPPAVAVVRPAPAVVPKLPPAAAVPPEPNLPAAREPVVVSPQSLPGKMVGKARDVVAARDQSGQVSGVGEILGDIPDAPTPLRATVPAAIASGPIATRDIPLDASAPPPEAIVDKPAAPPPSIAFRTFVANLRVSGVFQGEPGRALLNGKTIRIGEIADNTLSIRLTRLDYDRKILFFEDAAGSIMQRRY